jgi:hypothetical protein
MALTETDRVTLYWSVSALESLRIESKKCPEATPQERRTNHAETLDGGCLLYRICPFDRLREEPQDYS